MKETETPPDALFHADNIIVHRLSAGEDRHLRTGTHLFKQGPGLLSVRLLHILAEVQGDEGGFPPGGVLRQLVEQRVKGIVRVEELAFLQGQIIALLDGEAVEVGVPCLLYTSPSPRD